MLQRPKNQSSNVVITIKYGGLKATQFFSKYTAQAYRQLLEDLRELGFPFPKKSNIVFLSHGTLEFFWPIALHEKSHFTASLVSRVNLPTSGLFKDEQIAMRSRLSMYMLQDELPFSLTVREDQKYDPYSRIQNSGPQVSQTPPTHVATLPNKPPPELILKNGRYHPYSRPQPPATVNNNAGHRVSQAEPVSGTVRAAETFLDEVGTTLGMVAQPKSETAEHMVARPIQQLPPSSKPPESRITRKKSIQVKQENSSPKLSWLSGPSASSVASNTAASGPAPPPVSTLSSPSAGYHSQNQSTPNVVPPQNRNTSGTSIVAPSAPHRSPTMHLRACPASASGPIQSILTRDHPREIILPQRPPPNAPTGPTALTRHPRKSDTVTTSNPPVPASHQSLESSASRGTMQQRPTQAGSSMPAPAIPSSSLPATPTPLLQQPTHQILSSLDEFTKMITSAIERQNRVVDELHQRKVAVVPPKLSLLSSNDVAATKAKLQEMEKELELERAKHSDSKLAVAKAVGEARARRTEMEIALESERVKRFEMEAVLKAERTKRIEMENVLKDIERECKSPFVVPALLDTFIQVSQATTAAINHQASSQTDI